MAENTSQRIVCKTYGKVYGKRMAAVRDKVHFRCGCAKVGFEAQDKAVFK